MPPSTVISSVCSSLCLFWQTFELGFQEHTALVQVSHWQESLSQKILRRNYSIFSRSLEKIGFSFLFLFLIFKIFKNLFYLSSQFMRIFNPFSVSFQFSRSLRKNSRSLLDWWDSETQILFSSRFSRFWEKILLLFSISKIPKNKIF